jgi:hypothetical protein
VKEECFMKHKPLLVFLLCAVVTFVPAAVIRALTDSGEDFEFEWLSKPTNYASLGFTEGRVWVQKKENGPWTLYDEDWNVLKADFDVERVESFSYGVSCYWVKGKRGYTFGFLNLSGDVIIPPRDYGTTGGYYDGFMPKMGENDRLGFVNASGDWVISPDHNYEYAYTYDYDDKYFYMGTAVIKRGKSGRGVIDRKGREIVPRMAQVSYFSDGLIAVQPEEDGKWGYFNEDGKVAIGQRFDNAGDFMDGAAVVKEGALYGLIDKSGKYIVEPKYEYAYQGIRMNPNLRPVVLNGKMGYIDSKGNVAIDFKFISPLPPGKSYRKMPVSNELTFSKGRGRAFVNIVNESGNPALGVIDEAGNIVYSVDGVKSFFGFNSGDYLPLITDEGLCVFDMDGRKYNLSSHVSLIDLESVSVYDNNIFGIKYIRGGLGASARERSSRAGYFKIIPKGGQR